jgi:adhesin transport system outer membrane protein
MKMKMKIVLFFILSTLGVFGQSLQYIVKKGLDHDPRVRVLVHEYNSALKDIALVEANYRPTVDVTGFIGKERTQTPANIGKSKTYTAKNIGITGKYNLFSGYKKEFLVKEKEAAARLAENKLKEGLIKISKEISLAYIDMIKKYQIYRKYQKNITNYKRTLKKVSFKIKDGGGRDSDLFQTKSRMNYEETNLLTAKQQFEDSKIALGKYLGRVPDIGGMRDPRVNTKYLNLKRLIGKTKKYNASLGNLVVQKEISNFLMEQQKSNMYPTLDLEISKNWAEDQHGILGIDNSDRIGLNLKYNIYNGGADTLKIEKAKIQILKSGDSIEDAKREILVSLKRTYNNYLMYRKKLSVINKHIRNAKKTERLYIKEEEETGERSIIDILNIQQEYNSAEITKIDTKYTAMQLYFDLLANTSEILDYFKISR